MLSGCHDDHNKPSITGVTPTSGQAGDAVTITGKNFSTTAANNIVKFNGTTAVVTSATSREIVTAVPSGATTGRITVRAHGHTATSSSDFTVNSSSVGASPTITGFTPATGLVGAALTITGTNFSTTGADNTVKFNGTTAVVNSSTATQIIASVPEGATSGTISVTVNGITAISSASFTVVSPPTITGFTPTTGEVGDTVNITGANFSATAANNIVKFNGITAAVTSSTATQIVTSVPEGATTGKITVAVNERTATSASDFTVESSSTSELAYVLATKSTYDEVNDIYINVDQILTFTVNPGTGALTAAGTPVDIDRTDGYKYSIAIHPTGKFAYIISSLEETITWYDIDDSTGQMTEAGTVSGPWGEVMTIDPTGKFLYANDDSNDNIWSYSIDGDTGALTYSSQSSYIYGGANSIAIDPSGKFLYEVAYWMDKIYIYTIDSSTGALTSVADTDTGYRPFDAVIDPSGKFLYTTSYGDDTISVSAVNQTTGELTDLGTPLSTEEYPEYLAIDPSGKFLYATHNSDNGISAYRVDETTGALTSIGNYSVTDGSDSINSIIVDVSGRFLYALDRYDDEVEVFVINQTTGALTAGTPAAVEGANAIITMGE